jgi:hypothetical protein
MTVGLGGIGFVWCRPVVVNDQWSLAFTSAASTGGLNTALSAFTQSQLAYLANCPYTATQFGDDEVLARNTAFGVRIKYTGKLMDRNGVTYTFEHPDRENLDTWTIQQIIDSNFCKQQAVLGKKWDAAVCCSGPVSPTNLEYTKDIYQGSSHVWIGIIVTGEPGDTYMIDYANRTEYLGPIISQKTMSHPAGTQYGSVIAAAKNQVLSTGPLKPSDSGGVWEKFKGFVSENVPMLIEGTKAAAGFVASAITGNPMGALSAMGSVANLLSPSHDVPKLMQHQIQPNSHPKATRLLKDSLTEAHQFTPYDPLVRDYFLWVVTTYDESSGFAYVGIPKSQMFCKPGNYLWDDNSSDQTLLCAAMNLVFLAYVATLQSTATEADIEYWSNRTQDLLDLYFGDDVPPTTKQRILNLSKFKEKQIEVEKPNPSNEAARKASTRPNFLM